MIANGQIVGDGTWDLRVLVTDLQTERLIRVKGDTHIGGVMLKLVEDLEISMDWSDHALWWPMQNIWLTRTRSTLDQCGVHADALLYFTPMHKTLRLQLPDLRYIDTRVDFSVKTFSAVTQLCKDLNIRHPEELSLCKPLEHNHLKYNYKDMPKKKQLQEPHLGGGYAPADTNTFIANSSPDGSTGSLDKSPFTCAPITPSRGAPPSSTPINSPAGNGTWKRNGYGADMNGTLNYSPNVSNSLSLEHLNGSLDSSLAQSPSTPTPEARRHLIRPKSLVEKARMNVAWLDSSLSIMEQGVREHDTLCLKFKFYAFYDLNPKYDAIRINQIYEQAKWQLLNEEIDCTEEEMLMFAALQLQVKLQANQPQPSPDSNGSTPSPIEDDIDAALNNLQTTLEGSSISTFSNNITQVPELKDQLRFFKPKKFTLKAYKKYWFTCRDLHLYIYKTKGDMMDGQNSIQSVNLKGCEVTPDVNITQNKYVIKLEVPSSDGMSDMYIRCDNETQYAQWMACCRLASKGRSLADSSYESEKKTILDFLNLQRPSEQPVLNPNNLDIQVEDFIAPKYLKKSKGKLMQRILEAHANVKDLGLVDAKMSYIKAWQLLPDYGVSLFVVKFQTSKKEDLLGVGYNRLMKMDVGSGDHQKTWRFNAMKAWNVNWEHKHMMVQFEDDNIVFSCLSADCKVVHEFIGGYIFLSMRSKDANQTLNEELFHKLTGGWS